ncbi:hypothetical protein ACGC1H_005687 [Rhizoctonia solani]
MTIGGLKNVAWTLTHSWRPRHDQVTAVHAAVTTLFLQLPPHVPHTIDHMSPGTVPVSRASQNAIPDQYLVCLKEHSDVASHLSWLEQQIPKSDKSKVVYKYGRKYLFTD